ncbi:MAG: 4-hydroxy-tetrahydrodipicolinate reductase [Chitinophagales bacterium]
MNVALIGYGKMGKTIEKILLERGHEIVLKIGSSNLADLTIKNLQKADVAIEFTKPDSAVANYYKCFEAGIPVVSGTTAWLNKLDEVKQKLKEKNATLFYAPNFSIGVNIFFKVNEVLAKLMNNHTNYNVEMEEIHHLQKLDSPSGTAIKTAEGILKNLERKTTWKEAEEVSENEIQIHAKREKGVAGTHAVHYFSEEDSIELKHTAHSRKGFALGAVLAAEWVLGKKGIFGMENMLAF